jgi:putative membrane protein
MMGWHVGMGGWGAMGLMVVVSVLFWAAFVGGLVLLAKAAAATTGPQTPAQALAHRFARGEIDEEEYRSRLAVLGDRQT